MVEVGEIVTLRDWHDEEIAVRVKRLGNSPMYGETIEGLVVVQGVSERHVTLPLSHLVQTATVANLGRGKWNVTLPDGKIKRMKSKKAVKEYCDKHRFVLQEI
jgi:hypothetical protein